MENCSSPFDTRDSIINQFNQFIKNPSKLNNYSQASEVQQQYDVQELNMRVAEATNQRKLW